MLEKYEYLIKVDIQETDKMLEWFFISHYILIL